MLAGALATEYARGKGFGPFNTETDESRAAYEKQKHEKPFGTVGCVVMDAEGRLAAATSTGGKGFEIPGRVSDSATVAGNYADIHAAVSCTGTGEDIVNGAVAARFVTRIGDGMTLEQAAEKAEAELKQHKRNAGFIAITAKGAWVTGASSPFLPYAAYDGKVTLFS